MKVKIIPILVIGFSLCFWLGCFDSNTNSTPVQNNADIQDNPPSANGSLGEVSDSGPTSIGFYNVENFFDLEDEPRKDDEFFTPSGRAKWTYDRYAKKMNNIGKVIKEMGQPALMGLCEVENKTVLADLVKHKTIKSAGYAYAHEESPDNRGIDVALLYRKKDFTLESQEVIRINFPRSIVTNYTTRDILYVKGIFRNSERVHVFINHWPSRRDGQAASEPKRTYVAQQLRNKLDDIFRKEKNANVIIMGDFNDEPSNKSVDEVLGAQKPSGKGKQGTLYNLTLPLESSGKGSYNYRGDWNMLDQVIVSGGLMDGQGWEADDAEVFSKDWLLFRHPKNGPTPNRTYGGTKYYGGYSDHLPVKAELFYKE